MAATDEEATSTSVRPVGRGASTVSIDAQHGTARFPSVRSMVEADLRGWLPAIGVLLDDDLIETIVIEANNALGDYVSIDGEMVFDGLCPHRHSSGLTTARSNEASTQSSGMSSRSTTQCHRRRMSV